MRLPIIVGQWVLMPVSGRLHRKAPGPPAVFNPVHHQPQVIQDGQQAGYQHQRKDGGKRHAGGDGKRHRDEEFGLEISLQNQRGQTAHRT